MFFSGIIWMAFGYITTISSQVVASLILTTVAPSTDTIYLDDNPPTDIWLDGDLFSIAFPIELIVVTAVLATVVRVRRERNILEFFAFVSVSIASLAKWVSLAAILATANFISDKIFNRPDVSDWVTTLMNSTDWKLPFFLSVTLVAPTVEELLYRGYVIQAWLDAKLDRVLLMVLLSALWSLSHLQYDLYDMVWIFTLGLLLAYSRLRSRSIYPPLIIHIFWNFTAYINATLYSTT